ncbi:DUF427-domain-containing protein [Xylariaceae sp. FL0016]|nr:DUF427-domain-containing protein [Xylariaceae sp. FL0016]
MASPFSKPDLPSLAKKLLEAGPHKTLKTPKRIRIEFNSAIVADTTSAVYVWEHPYYPYYYLPRSAFSVPLTPTTTTTTSSPSDSFSDSSFRTAVLRVADRSTDRLLLFGPDVGRTHGPACAPLADTVRLEFAAAGAAWFEEDTRIAVHPKDPFRRVDVVHSVRPVRVFTADRRTLLADAPGGSYHLYETGLPVRYYVPPTSVAAAAAAASVGGGGHTGDGLGVRLRDSGLTTACPYKGEANYYDVEIQGKGGDVERLENIVWYYKTPTTECAAIAGCLCFYNEKVAIELDGEWLEQPKTIFS